MERVGRVQHGTVQTIHVPTQTREIAAVPVVNVGYREPINGGRLPQAAAVTVCAECAREAAVRARMQQPYADRANVSLACRHVVTRR